MINYSICIMSTKPGTKKADITQTKAYGTAQMNEKLTFDQFCKHIADHNSPFSKGTIKGVLTDAVVCLKEQLLAGNKVNLGDLGDFHVELATKGAKTTEDFNASYIERPDSVSRTFAAKPPSSSFLVAKPKPTPSKLSGMRTLFKASNRPPLTPP